MLMMTMLLVPVRILLAHEIGSTNFANSFRFFSVLHKLRFLLCTGFSNVFVQRDRFLPPCDFFLR